MRAQILLCNCICLLLFAACNKKDTEYQSGTNDPAVSQYYVLDIKSAIPRTGLILLNLAAFQQTTEYTCGPAAVVSLLGFYGQTADEMELASEMNTSTTTGTTPENMAIWLENNGFDVTWGEHGSLELIRDNLSKNTPTLVEWSDWGGHWVVAVGYDTRNTENPMDDVIIFADPYDRHDDNMDGIDWFNAQRFYYMWYDALLFGKVMKQVFIVATPVKKQPVQ